MPTPRGFSIGETDDEESNLQAELGLTADGFARPIRDRQQVGAGEVSLPDVGSGRTNATTTLPAARGILATGLSADDTQVAAGLVGVLAPGADRVEDADDADALHKAGRLLRKLSAAAFADAIAASIRSQPGVG
jgi:hypothetical protein